MKLKLSVKKLVDFACRSGDLSGIGVAGPTALQGIKAHQKIQSERSANQEKEVSLVACLQCDNVEVELAGRVDLLDRHRSPPQLLEIKSTLVAPIHLDPSMLQLHWAQLKVYGFLYLTALRAKGSIQIRQDDTTVELVLLWVNLRDGQQTRDSQEYDFDQLSEYSLSALKRYVDWYCEVELSRLKMRKSAVAMEFPFEEFRVGQRDMAAAVFRSHRDGEVLMCEAPTGVGKTISSLFPAVKAMGQGYIKKVVYLTAKTPGRLAAFDAISLMKQSGFRPTYLVLQSKASICHCSNGTCARDADGRCPLTIDFFDRLPEARKKLFRAGSISTELIDQAAHEFQVCPFELSLQLLPWVDVAVCDYNYVFDPLVRLTYFAENEKKIGFLVDEVHNLSDRARNMYSAKLERAHVLAVAQECFEHPLLEKNLKALSRAMDRWAKTRDSDDWASADKPATVTRAVDKVLTVIDGQPGSTTKPVPESVWELFRELFRYKVIEELFGDNHRTLTQKSTWGKNRNTVLRLQCLNASEKLQGSFALMHSAAVFSATLRPADFHARNLGLSSIARLLTIASPFSVEQLSCLLCSHIDTRYRSRTASLDSLVSLIHLVSNSHAGNYLVFFPSYSYMQKVHAAYIEQYPLASVSVQLRQSSEEERASFLQSFEPGNPVLGFAIMGGIYGEGIDFVGEKLVGAIIVGTGLPAFGTEQNLVAENYEEAGFNGFDYAFRYPGFTRVLQTAGRVIRKETDRGVVVLVDQRFDERFYHELYPPQWQANLCRSNDDAKRQLDSFWNGKQFCGETKPARVPEQSR